MVNIELAIINLKGEVLLTHRNASSDIPIAGWHLPGGIIRVGEKLQDRIKKTALDECGFLPIEHRIIGISETLIEKKIARRHFLSILVVCICETQILPNTISKGSKEMRWFASKEIPVDLIPNHERYREILTRLCCTRGTMYKPILTIDQGDFSNLF